MLCVTDNLWHLANVKEFSERIARTILKESHKVAVVQQLHRKATFSAFQKHNLRPVTF